MTDMRQSNIESGRTSLPRVSIGLPLYNESAYVKTALDSLLAQDFTDFELIISDNASTDETFEICRAYAAADPRIRLYRHDRNVGPVANFATVLSHARSPYFMWAAADDRWEPEFVGTLVRELDRHHEVVVAMTGIRRVREDGSDFDVIRFSGCGPSVRLSRWEALKGLTSPRKHSLFIYGLFRTDIVRRAMPYFPEVLGGDRIFMCQFPLAGPFHYVDRLLYIRTHRADHEAAYRRQAAIWTTPLKQVAAMVRVLLLSPIADMRGRLLIPIGIVRYSAMILGKRLAPKPVWSLIRKVLMKGVPWKSKVTMFGGAVAATAIALTSAVATTGHPLLGFGVGLGLLSVASLALSIYIARALPKTSGVLLREFAAQVASLGSRLDSVQSRIVLVQREARYVTDAAIGATSLEVEPEAGGDSLARYHAQRLEKHRRMVAFARAVKASRIRELYLAEIFPGIDRVAVPVGAINELTGHPNKVDMLYVCAVARHRNARRLFEFGTYQGRTTYHLTLAARDAHVVTLNLPPEADPRYGPHLGRYFKGTDRERFITQILCDSRTFDTTPHRGQYDFVFVDGDHSYEGVKNDTMKAFELLRPGGIIMWHDYAPKTEDLVRFFQDFTQERPLFRIKRTCLLLHIDGVDPLTFEPHPMLASLEREFFDSDPFWVEEIYHA